jgi:hypothetical protein
LRDEGNRIFISMICYKCKLSKDKTDFHKRTKNKRGYDDWCKSCKKEYHKAYSVNSRDVIYAYKNKNRDKIQDYQAEYMRKYTFDRYHNDESYRIKCLLRARIYGAFKHTQTTKHNKTTDLIGCSYDQLKSHLESQFKPEMNWNNHGVVWEIDHIKPCSFFNLTNVEQQKQCFHYTNLQPLFKTTILAESLGYTNEIGNRNKFNRH